jgi:hypothetical protein
MIVVVLSWTQPVPGTHGILFPDESEIDLGEAIAWLRGRWGDGEWGHFVAEVELESRSPSRLTFQPREVASAWADLALNVRYAGGEGLYEIDCPAFARRGIRRA